MRSAWSDSPSSGRRMIVATSPASNCSSTGHGINLASNGYPIDASGRIVEHRGALGCGVALRQPFEGVVHHVVGVGQLVDGGGALEHAPVGAELLDAIGDEGGHRRRELVRADGCAPGVPVKPGAGHADAAEL